MAFWNSVLRTASTQGLIKLRWSVSPDKPFEELWLMKRRAVSNKESSVCPRNPRDNELQEFGVSCLLLKKRSSICSSLTRKEDSPWFPNHCTKKRWQRLDKGTSENCGK
ncbi:hypothetical protein MRX96_054198 [Rhipicephalus microplus]